jgi:coenzyme F420-0:L-glutamate ligase/coenzyme F420-1:gamma-L-glutamate ligase
MDSQDSPLLKLMQTRRSLRRYLPDPVPPALIERLLTAAIWAPSAHNRQPWRFVVVQSTEQKQRLAQAMGARLRADLQADGLSEALIEADISRSYERLAGAPVLIVLCLSMLDMDIYPDVRRNQNETLMAVQSVAMAGQNLLLAAHEAGLGACWMCAPLFVPEVVRAALQIPEDWQAQGVISLGYAAQIREKDRAPLETKVMWR